MARFIPNLATHNQPLRELLKDDAEWTWGPPQQEAFQKIKDILLPSATMAHYNPKLEAIVSCAASNVGLGATLYQVQQDGTRQPVCYASRLLTDTEKRYAVIKKEASAATWACEKFHQCLLWLQFLIKTDHKPLVPLLSVKDLDKVPARVLHMRLRLMRYAPEVVHVSAKRNQIADALSRAPSERPVEVDIVLLSEIESSAHLPIPENPNITSLRAAQHEDPICQAVTQLIKDG